MFFHVCCKYIFRNLISDKGPIKKGMAPLKKLYAKIVSILDNSVRSFKSAWTKNVTNQCFLDHKLVIFRY